MKLSLFIVGCLILLVGTAGAQNLLANPGFESTFTSWTTCGGPAQDMSSYTPVPHSGASAHNSCGCCGSYGSAGGGYQSVATASGSSYTVGGWARQCGDAAAVSRVGWGGTTCGTPSTILGSQTGGGCTWTQYVTTVTGQTSIAVHFAFPAHGGWQMNCVANDDMEVTLQAAVDDWMLF